MYLDESGSIHKNSNANHFAIGGYIVYGDRFASSKVINRYKRINKKHKKIRNTFATLVSLLISCALSGRKNDAKSFINNSRDSRYPEPHILFNPIFSATAY